MASKIAELQFSEAAANHLSNLIAAANKETFLRISVSGGGCSGFQYHFDFAEGEAGDDLKINHQTKTLGLIDETSHELLKGSEVDFVDELGGNYFKINNPNASSSCGCGSSFAV